jgi:predicted secreted protein
MYSFFTIFAFLRNIPLFWSSQFRQKTMNKKLIIIISCIIAILPVIHLNAQQSGEVISGEMIIQLHQSNDIQQLEKSFSPFEFQIKEVLSKRLNIFLVNFNPVKTNAKSLLSSLRAAPQVHRAQYNHYVELRENIEYQPNDPDFNQQWDMHNTGENGAVAGADIDALRAWDITTGGVTILGDTIVVAVIDGGSSLGHNDLNHFKNRNEIRGNGIDDDENGYTDDYDGWNAYNNSGTIPEHAHGAHVSGTIGARGNNETGVTGVNWNVKVLPIAGSSTLESIVIRAYSYAYEMRALYDETNGQKGAFIVATNSSFGINNGQPDEYPVWESMYDSLGALGILNAGATANANVNVDEAGDIPTAFETPWLITVTNTTNQDKKFSSAGYGANSIDLGAPGTQIYSTTLNNTYGVKTGTSMACPHVAGAIAMLFAAADSTFMLAYQINPAAKILEIKQFLLNGTDPLTDLEGITVSGGRLNLYNSLMLLQQPIDLELTIDTLNFVLQADSDTNEIFSVKNIGNDTILMELIIPEQPTWISLNTDSIVIAASDSSLFEVTVNADGLTEGFYHTNIQLFANEIFFKAVTVNLQVYQPEIVLNTDSISMILIVNTLTDTSLQISNPAPVSNFIRLTTDSANDWLMINPDTVTIAANESSIINLKFNTGGLAVGNYAAEISIDATEGENKNVIVSMQVYDPSAIQESHKAGIQIQSSPNPFTEYTQFKIRQAGFDPFLFEIRNKLGQLVFSQAVHPVEHQFNISWSGNNQEGNSCANGTYFYSVIRHGKVISSGKILKQ